MECISLIGEKKNDDDEQQDEKEREEVQWDHGKDEQGCRVY